MTGCGGVLAALPDDEVEDVDGNRVDVDGIGHAVPVVQRVEAFGPGPRVVVGDRAAQVDRPRADVPDVAAHALAQPQQRVLEVAAGGGVRGDRRARRHHGADETTGLCEQVGGTADERRDGRGVVMATATSALSRASARDEPAVARASATTAGACAVSRSARPSVAAAGGVLGWQGLPQERPRCSSGFCRCSPQPSAPSPPPTPNRRFEPELLGSGFTRPIAVVFDPVVPGAVHVVQQGGLVRTFHNGAFRADAVPRPDRRGLGRQRRARAARHGVPARCRRDRPRVRELHQSHRGGQHRGRAVHAQRRRSAGRRSRRRASISNCPASGGGRQGFITQPFSNHNGGNLVFGPDGYLYIGLGDGGAGDDPNNNAQTPTTLLGKMLRIDVSGSPANGYTVPADNPDFSAVGINNALPEIWSFGLRNPWRYSFDDVGAGATGALVIGDVGQGEREEIDYEPVGRKAAQLRLEHVRGLGRQPAIRARRRRSSR